MSSTTKGGKESPSTWGNGAKIRSKPIATTFSTPIEFLPLIAWGFLGTTTTVNRRALDRLNFFVLLNFSFRFLKLQWFPRTTSVVCTDQILQQEDSGGLH
jgi:hypothetical protein